MSTELLNLANLSREQIENRLIQIAGAADAADADPVLRAEKRFLEKALGVLSAHDFLQSAIAERDAEKRKAIEEIVIQAFWLACEVNLHSTKAADFLKEAGGTSSVVVFGDGKAMETISLKFGEATIEAFYPTRAATSAEIAAQKQREKNGGGVVVAEVPQ